MKTVKQYWPMATDLKNDECHLLFTYDSTLTMTEAEKQIDLWKKNFDVITAWIMESESGLIVYHKCYVDAFGNRRK